MADGYSNTTGRNGDLQEEDVWAVVKESSRVEKAIIYSSTGSGSTAAASASAWRLASAPKVISMPKTHDPGVINQTQSSTAMSIPEWSKIYRKNPKKFGLEKDENEDDDDDDDDDLDDDDNETMPPHEYVARKMARTRISSFSMCEGIGRTLKGRDLSKVRNAILTRTGFLE
ncbi:uncharacterized protein LOC127795275 [Diospyros lotus]|uniref:uncharacterized protein LOC127795275 n=1 Tax=Diospyros lotus TaxID=55363 RepID=UPI002254C2FF|nr:uncharacterized protein LOC127795275 [Diospyros lotus]